MINSAILEVVIGLIFVYWLLALICSTANEIIVGIFGLRSRQLQNGIRRLLEGGQKPKVTPTKDFVDKVLNNHLILGLTIKDQVAIKGPFATGPLTSRRAHLPLLFSTRCFRFKVVCLR